MKKMMMMTSLQSSGLQCTCRECSQAWQTMIQCSWQTVDHDDQLEYWTNLWKKLIMNNISVKIPLQESTLYSPPMLGHHLKSICWKCFLLKSVHLPCTCEGWFFYMDNISIIRISHHRNFLHLGTFSLNKGKEKTRKDECKVHNVQSPIINLNLKTFV